MMQTRFQASPRGARTRACATTIVFFLAAALLCGQTAPPTPSAADQEQADLSRAISESGTTGIDFMRALEHHLQKYPQTAQRAAIEKALAKAALDSNDHARIILYGEKVLAAEPTSSDLQLMDAVTRALLDSDDAAAAKIALPYAKRYEAAVKAMSSRGAESHMSPVLWAEEVNKGTARAMVLEARATGNAGNAEEALKIARAASLAYPNAEAAREIGRWLVKLGRSAEAIEYYADAFGMEDPRTTDADRARDRARAGELYAKVNGSEKGLGDVLLRAYDHAAALKTAHMELLKQLDPNAVANDVLDFTLPRAGGGDHLALSSLKGKTVVMDFWATWCGPCRVQHPMIENVKQHFEKAGDVVFLSVDADDDHSLVAPFLRDMKWDDAVYFDGGLSYLMKITSMPTIVVLDAAGKVSSRMQGFIPERFEDMLTERIDDARGPRN